MSGADDRRRNREQMPEISAWFDYLREKVGKEAIDRQIRRGMKGEVVFHAWENGHKLGAPSDRGVQLSARNPAVEGTAPPVAGRAGARRR